METTGAFQGLGCVDCGEAFTVETYGKCPSCGGILDTVYDLTAAFEDATSATYPTAPTAFPASAVYTAGEGSTPLVETANLADELGVERLFVKDEARNPTGTVYDRGMAPAVTAARAVGVEPVALAAAGNAAQSAAAYAGRADLRSYAFVPARTAFSNKAMVNVHGGEMQVAGGRYGDAVQAVDEQLATDYYPLGAFRSPFRHDGTKTLVYETLRQYTDLIDGIEEGQLSTPDTVVVPVGTGEVLVAVHRGLTELQEAGFLSELPTVAAVQPAGCAPIVTAAQADEEPEPWANPDTIVGELEIPDPLGGSLAATALADLPSHAVTVDDSDALESAVTVARREVLEVGGAGGVAVAGAWELAERDELDGDVVVVNPDAGVKTPDVLRSHLMGKGI